MTRYYRNQKAIRFSCTRQPSSSFTFQKYKKEIHIAVAPTTRVKTWLSSLAEICSFLDYYSSVVYGWLVLFLRIVLTQQGRRILRLQCVPHGIIPQFSACQWKEMIYLIMIKDHNQQHNSFMKIITI